MLLLWEIVVTMLRNIHALSLKANINLRFKMRSQTSSSIIKIAIYFHIRIPCRKRRHGYDLEKRRGSIENGENYVNCTF